MRAAASALASRVGDGNVCTGATGSRRGSWRAPSPADAAAWRGGAHEAVWVALQLALNGQDFEPLPPLPYGFYPHPTLHSVTPPGARPGNVVTMVGHNLHRGSEGVAYSCRFGTTVVPATAQPQQMVVANVWRTHTVRCVAPPQADDGTANVRVSVSLNGLDYTEEDVRFTFLR